MSEFTKEELQTILDDLNRPSFLKDYYSDARENLRHKIQSIIDNNSDNEQRVYSNELIDLLDKQK